MINLLVGMWLVIGGIFVGAMVENYRAKVNWSCNLGDEWTPPAKAEEIR